MPQRCPIRHSQPEADDVEIGKHREYRAERPGEARRARRAKKRPQSGASGSVSECRGHQGEARSVSFRLPIVLLSQEPEISRVRIHRLLGVASSVMRPTTLAPAWEA